MKISIITPVYNAAKTVEKTILSVINQEINSELEYIVIDGNSNDGTLDIIKRYSHQINTLVSQKDEGVYDAMNKGIALATGDIIGILNADDWYNSQALQTVEKVFAGEPNLSILYSPIDNYYQGKYLNTFIPGSLSKLAFKFTLNHPSCFIKRSVYEKIGAFDLSYSIAADYDFVFRAFIAGESFKYVEKSLVSYSLNGMTGKPLNKFKQIRESWRVAEEYALKSERGLVKQRQRFYLNWLLKELFVFPIKPFMKPELSRKVKAMLREKIGGKLPSDQYGAW